jgi:TonB-linked SusC/RagA family outer membrane protein
MDRLFRSFAVFVVASLFAPLSLFAQGTIQGTVIDAQSGDPIPGAQVVVQGTSVGAATAANGTYEFSGVPTGEQVVEARFVGYRTQTETVQVEEGETIVLDFTLSQSAVDLEEVVVTGAGGPVERKRVGNTLATVNTSDLEEAPVKNFSEIIQGREPGVLGLPSSGATGEGARIRIRGSASLSQSNEPIVYVDGIRVDNSGGFAGGASAGGGGAPSRLDDINPESIERVEILKGAAAATLYGSEASNGVIQIFTKDGSSGAPEFTFETSQTMSHYPHRHEPNVGYASSEEAANNMSEQLGGSYQPYELVSRDWISDLYETGHSQEYSLSASGGSETVTYFMSGRYSHEDGPFGPGNDRGYPPGVSTRAKDLNRLAQLNVNVNVIPTEDLRVRTKMGYTDRHVEVPQNNNNTNGVLPLTTMGKPQLVGLNNREGVPVFATVNEVLQITTEQNAQHFNGSVGMNFRPTESLTIDGTFGLDLSNQRDVEERPYRWNVDGFTTSDTLGARELGNRTNQELTYDVKVNHEAEFGEQFENTFIVGSQGFFTQSTEEAIDAEQFSGPNLNVVTAAFRRNATESFREVVSLGTFVQNQIGYNEWIYVTLGGRLDANSAFGADFDAVFYPKIQTSLPLTDAPFWQPIGPASSLRLRAALGQSGLQPGAFDALRTFAPISSEEGPGVTPDNLGNPNLKPEVATEWEVGFEMGVLEDRIALDATYWNRTVSDALVERQNHPTGGFRSLALDNIGELNAQGIELSVDGTVIERNNFSVDLNANTSYLWEEVTDLGGAPPIKVGGSYPRDRNFLREGYAPGAFFGARLQDTPEGQLPVDTNDDGEADTEQELLSYLDGLDPSTASLSALNDHVLLADEDGDGDLLDHYLGKPMPDWQGSFGGSVQYGGFRLQTLFEYKTGNFSIHNLGGAFRNANPVIGRNTPQTAELERDYETGGVDENYQPQDDPEVRLDAAKRWVNEFLDLAPFSGLNHVENADFVRWRELSLTYRLSDSMLERFPSLRNASISLRGRNLMLFTGYSGMDPETNAIGRGGDDELSNNFLIGQEVFGYPLQREFSVALRIGF